MKKLAVSLVAIVSAIIMCFALTACTPKVAGKSYEFDKVEVEGTYPDSIKSLVDTAVNKINDNYKGGYMEFNKDGKVESFLNNTSVGTSYYKQDGKDIYISQKEGEFGDKPTAKVDGKNIIVSNSQTIGTTSVTINIVYKQK